MAKAKGIRTLIRLAKFNVDEKRRVLVALQDREEEIIAAIAAHDQQLKVEQQVASEDSTGAGFYYGAYADWYLKRRAEMEGMLAAVRQQIEIARDDLAEAFREQKTYEITQANREKREREEADRKEQIFLDEVGQTQHRRKEEEA